jgi:hypothetical protein
LPTVILEHLNCSAAAVLLRPSAHANTIFDLNANDCAEDARRDHRSN